MANITMTDSEQEIVKNILRLLLPTGYKVYVFGSRAMGKAGKGSDLDLLVCGDNLYLEDKTLYTLKEAFMESLLPYDVDIVQENNIFAGYLNSIHEYKILLLKT